MGKKNHKGAPFMCGQCKQGFGSQKAVQDHIAGAHPDIHQCGVFKCIERMDGPNYEPSYADRAIAASLALAMGDPTDDEWLLS